PGSRLMSTTRPAKPSSRSVTAALPPARPPPTISICLPVSCVGIRQARSRSLPRRCAACWRDRGELGLDAVEELVIGRAERFDALTFEFGGDGVEIDPDAVRVGERRPCCGRVGVECPD